MLIARRFLSTRWRKNVTLRVKKCQGVPPETLNSSKSIVKRDNGYLCLLCNAEIAANWRGTSKFIPELFLFATSAQRVSRGKTT